MLRAAIFAYLVVALGACQKTDDAKDGKAAQTSAATTGAKCTDAYPAFKAVVERAKLLPKACAAASDCVRFGSPSAACKGDEVTSAAALATVQGELDTALARISECTQGATGKIACGEVEATCDMVAKTCVAKPVAEAAAEDQDACGDARATIESLSQRLRDAAEADACAVDADCARGPVLGSLGCGGVEVFTSSKAFAEIKDTYAAAEAAEAKACPATAPQTDCQPSDASAAEPVCHPGSKRCVGRAAGFLDGACDVVEDPAMNGAFKGVCHVKGDDGRKYKLPSGTFLKPGTARVSAGDQAATATYTPLDGMLRFSGAAVVDGATLTFAYDGATREALEIACAGAAKDYDAFTKPLLDDGVCTVDADCAPLPARADDPCHARIEMASTPALAADGRQAALTGLTQALAESCAPLNAETSCDLSVRAVTRKCEDARCKQP